MSQSATTYNQSQTISQSGGIIPIYIDCSKSAIVTIAPNALSGYLKEQKIKSVQITVKMREVKDALELTFGPSGCYFDPPLMFSLTGDYIHKDMQLYGENGEALEYSSYFDGQVLIYEIPHFSKYSYDHYY